MEALFPLRTSNMLQCMSWPELEYSYGLHLSNVIERLGFAKRDNAIGYTDSDITSVLIETGRFFTELDYSNRPKDFREGNNPDAAGPFLNGPWSEDTRNRFNLNELHRRCHENGLIKDWEYNNILRVVFNSNSRTGTTERQSQLTYILEAIFTINTARRKNWCEGPYPKKKARCSYSISWDFSMFQIREMILSSQTIRSLQPMISISRH